MTVAIHAVGCGRLAFAPGEAPDGAPGDTAPPCIAPCFSDDFDTPPLGQRWSGFSTTASAALSLGSNAVSPPNSMHAQIDPTAAAADRQALLVENLPAMKSITCSFELALEQAATTERARIVSLFVNNALWSGYELNVWIQKDGTTLLEEWGIFASDGTSFITGTPGAPFDTTGWVHVDFEADYAGSARVFANGSPIAAIAMYPQTPAGETFFFGLRSDGTGGWNASFDDVRCTPTL